MEEKKFSARAWGSGCFVAVASGCVLNMMVIMIGLRINITVVAAILGVLPGIGIIVASRRSKEHNFAMGLLVGAIVIAILGGACAAIFTATQVKH
jgi:hypothetical protein